MRFAGRGLVAAVGCALLVAGCGGGGPAGPAPVAGPARAAVAVGTGGAVSSVNPYASRAGIEVLRAGGNAVDAAVATAAALGVAEPYSAGIGGGGYFLYYDARSRTVHTIDGRETAPAAMRPDSFLDPATGKPIPFRQAVNSGLSVGVPGTPATWDRALHNWGSLSVESALAPAIQLAQNGFVVSQQFRDETVMNQKRFRDIAPTAALYLPGGQPPAVGSVLRNPDLAATYRTLAKDGISAFYRGDLAAEVASAAQHPPLTPGAARVFRPGLLQASDLAAYQVREPPPTHSSYRGVELYGMAPSSSGGSTVGEALNILSNFQLSAGNADDRVQALQHFLEASRIAYADRNRWVGDSAFGAVPLSELLSAEFGKDRACLISPVHTLNSPVAPGDPNHPVPCAPGANQPAPAGAPREGTSTTHLVTADRWGNVVSYTLTIEQTGG
ncbi:MAG TPA: gamma-glutamyltransferase, partial [Pseudonocardia sp.]